MHILLILLGCNISYLLNNRIDTAINFVGKLNETNVDWFLSGGIKNPDQDTVSEAEKMAKQISRFDENRHYNKMTNKWNYVYDTVATNTAENFIMVKKFLKNANKEYNEIYIITSEFHHNRANEIAKQILDINPKWILGNAKLDDSDYWEKIHIKNVDADVKKAIQKFNY
jgi:hypothetical protein